MTDEKQRTAKQNRSLHSSLDAYAEQLNESGYEYYTFIERLHTNGVSTPWSKTNLKEIFNILTVAMHNKTSSELTTTEMGECWRVFEQKMLDLSGVMPTWRSRG